MSPRVIVDDAAGVRVLTLNRPEARNALDGALILPGGGLTARLPPLVGPGWARRMSFTGEVIDADRALRIGLVTEVVAHDRLLDRAVEVAAMAAEVPAETMRALKGVYVSGTAGTIGAALAAERAAADEQRLDLGLLEQRRAAVTERNRRQVRTGP